MAPISSIILQIIILLLTLPPPISFLFITMRQAIIKTLLTTLISSFCLVGHWCIQSLSFSFCLYAQIPCTHKASRTSIVRTSHHHHHHHHEGEEHEEGHQARHGCQYVVCSHSRS